MKLTYWEMSIINQSVGISGGATIAKLEAALGLRGKINKDEYNTIVALYFKNKDAGKENKVDIFTDGDEILFERAELEFAYEAISNPNLNLPILPESLALVNKLKDYVKNKEA